MVKKLLFDETWLNVREVKGDKLDVKKAYDVSFYAEMYDFMDLLNIQKVLLQHDINTNDKWVSSVRVSDGLLNIHLTFVLR